MPAKRDPKLIPRDREIFRLSLEGVGQKQLAKRFGLSRESIRNIIAREEAEANERKWKEQGVL